MSDLPGLDEEEFDGGEFRQRSGSAGIKSLIKFRSRNKSGDKQNPNAPPTDDKKAGLKGFFEAFRPRSKSDASTLKAAAMMRRKHASGGQAVQQVLTDNQQHLLGSGDLEPMQRQRSTSLGAKDKLRLMKEMRASGGAKTAKGTLMGQLISNGVNSQISHSSSEKVSQILPWLTWMELNYCSTHILEHIEFCRNRGFVADIQIACSDTNQWLSQPGMVCSHYCQLHLCPALLLI